jgi:hypothetical protein
VIAIADLERLLSRIPSRPVIRGVVRGDGLRVDIEDVDAARDLFVASDDMLLLYRNDIHWSQDVLTELTSQVEQDGVIRALAIAGDLHDGDLVSVSVDAVLHGVVHRITAVDERFASVVRATEKEVSREDARWMREAAADRRSYQERSDHVKRVALSVRTGLAQRLVADDLWLAAANRRAREIRARDIVYGEHPDLLGEQKIASAILDALENAQATRRAAGTG